MQAGDRTPDLMDARVPSFGCDDPGLYPLHPLWLAAQWTAGPAGCWAPPRVSRAL